METFTNDAHIMDLARRFAISFCRNHRPWGMDFDDVLSRILEEYVKVDWDVPDREAAARTAISYALNRCRDESKANRARLQPFQIRKAIERGEDVDKAINRLGNDIAAYYRRGNLDVVKERYLKIAIRHMHPNDAELCRAYLKLKSWQKVAEKFGYSEGSFRRDVLPGLAKRGREIWKKVW